MKRTLFIYQSRLQQEIGTQQKTLNTLFMIILAISVEDAKATTNYQEHGVLYNWDGAMEACPMVGAFLQMKNGIS